jgi:hypothetical protein
MESVSAEATRMFADIDFEVGRASTSRWSRSPERAVQHPGHRLAQLRARRQVGASSPAASPEAGADALELNLYSLPVDPAKSGAQVE